MPVTQQQTLSGVPGSSAAGGQIVAVKNSKIHICAMELMACLRLCPAESSAAARLTVHINR
jgi:hypothetical protein